MTMTGALFAIGSAAVALFAIGSAAVVLVLAARLGDARQQAAYAQGVAVSLAFLFTVLAASAWNMPPAPGRQEEGRRAPFTAGPGAPGRAQADGPGDLERDGAAR
jgi:hypothetical protein